MGVPIGLRRELTSLTSESERLLIELPKMGGARGRMSEEQTVRVWSAIWERTIAGGLAEAPSVNGSVAEHGARWRQVGYLADSGRLACSSAALGQWALAAAARIRSLAAGRTQRLLEIGCGTGMLAVQLASTYEYAGVDPVASAVHRLSLELPKAHFEVCDALSVPARLLSGRLVIVNSVAQYFPSMGYLRRVLRRCASCGALAVFVGDVRPAELLAHQRRMLHEEGMDERELTPPLAAFEGCGYDAVRVLLHSDGSRSHFERFRCDVYLDNEVSVAPPPRRDWTPAERFETAGWIRRVPNGALVEEGGGG